MASLCSPGEPVLALDVDRRTVNHLWFQDLITKGLVRVRSTPQPCNCLNAQTMTSDVVGRRAAGSGITNSGERQIQSSAGPPDFHLEELRCKRRTLSSRSSQLGQFSAPYRPQLQP